jgi:hypothetical protein
VFAAHLTGGSDPSQASVSSMKPTATYSSFAKSMLASFATELSMT